MKNKIILMFQIFIFSIAVVITVYAADQESNDNSTATKSYVDDKITQLLQTLESGGTINVTSSSGKAEGGYVPVHVGVGQKLVGEEGTEAILRVGRSFAVVPGEESLIDVTSGTELSDKGELKKNHVIIIPRNDGRGVRVVEDAWFLVKGGYTIGSVSQ